MHVTGNAADWGIALSSAVERRSCKHGCHLQVVNVMGFRMPYYQSPTLLLSLGLSVRVLWQLLRHRPDVIHVSSPGMLVFAAILYSKLLAIPLVPNTPSIVFPLQPLRNSQVYNCGWAASHFHQLEFPGVMIPPLWRAGCRCSI